MTRALFPNLRQLSKASSTLPKRRLFKEVFFGTNSAFHVYFADKVTEESITKSSEKQFFFKFDSFMKMLRKVVD